MTEGPAQPSTASTPGSDGPSGDLPAAAMVVTRSGGFAGFVDSIQIAADGTAQATRKGGVPFACTPDPAALSTLRAFDLAAVASAKPMPPIADGFSYSVTSAVGSVSAGDGEVGVRAEFVAAAAAVVNSCLASQPGAG